MIYLHIDNVKWGGGMKRNIIAIIAVVVIVGGYFGFVHYKQQKFVEQITPNVKKISLLLSNAIYYETHKDTKITYKELFDKLESDISEVDKLILDVQTIAKPDNKDVTDPVLLYLKNSQELLRNLLQLNRKVFALNSMSDMYSRLDKYFSIYGYSKAKFSEAKDIADKAIIEVGKSRSDILVVIKKIKDAHVKIYPIISGDSLVDLTIFDPIIKEYESVKFTPLQKDAKTGKIKAIEIPVGSGVIGTVTNTMNSGGYTYIEANNEKGANVWLALPNVTVSIGDKIEYPEVPPETNFICKSLKKTFNEIHFVPGIRAVK